MFSRYFVVLCAVALCAVVINAEIEEDVQVHDIDLNANKRANPAVIVVTKIIGYLFKGTAIRCLGNAARSCKDHWKNPVTAISCAKNFLEVNRSHCVVGKGDGQ